MKFRVPRSLLFYLWALAGVIFLVLLFILFTNTKPTPDGLNKPYEPSFIKPSQNQLFPFFKSSAKEKLSSLDGASLDAEFQEETIGIMLDNYFAARTQHSGVRKASIVYEALAEGGITRLMLLFPYQDLSRVGPLRSAREYFVRWAEEYGGIYVHAGGAPSALNELQTSENLYQLDEDDRIVGEHYSTRDLRYPTPHNLFVDLLLIRERAKEKSWELDASRKTWCFNEPSSSYNLIPTTYNLALAFSFDPQYDVTFQYDQDSDTYKRFYGNGQRLLPHTDQADGLQVAPRNIIVQIARSRAIPGDMKERIEVRDIGSGKAFLYRNGTRIAGVWEKTSRNAVTEFRDDFGKPFCLSKGQTWVAAVDSEEMMKELPQ